MENIVSWLSLGICLLLVVGCVALYIDGKGQRRALTVARSALAALQRQVTTHDEQIGNLTRAVALLAPSVPLVDDAADKAAIRASAEAEADARSQARRATVEDAAGVRRSLDAAPMERPVSSPTRAAETFGKRQAAITLHSAGNAPTATTPRTGTPVPPALPDAVDERYQALCKAARGAGLPADHCCGGDCYGTPESVLCTCSCDGCVRATSYAMQAEREIMGPSADDTDPRKRGA